MRYLLAAASLIAAAIPAQNFVPDGDFELGGTTWTRTQFNDPIGTTGFAAARTTGNGPSMAVFANFQTLTPVITATFVCPPFALPQATIPISFNVMWEKQVTMPIPQPTVNRVELRVYDSTNTRIFLGTQNSPNQTGLFERASFTQTLAVPAAGLYTAEIFMRHSNLATIPFINWVDDVVIGAPISFVFGQGGQGSGAFTPVINSKNVPKVNSTNFTIELHDALGPTAALLGLGHSRTSFLGVPLPLTLGGGSSLLVGPIFLLVNTAQGSGHGMGTAAQILAIPNDPSLTRAQLFAQWLTVDPAAGNPYQLATTAGLGFTLQ